MDNTITLGGRVGGRKGKMLGIDQQQAMSTMGEGAHHTAHTPHHIPSCLFILSSPKWISMNQYIYLCLFQNQTLQARKLCHLKPFWCKSAWASVLETLRPPPPALPSPSPAPPNPILYYCQHPPACVLMYSLIYFFSLHWPSIVVLMFL